MTWTLGEPITAAHAGRLADAGVERSVLEGLVLREVTGPLPEWWGENGNALYVEDGMTRDGLLGDRLPRRLIDTMTFYPFSDARLVVASDSRYLASLLLGGDRATVFLGRQVVLTAGEVFCGADSAIVLNGRTVGTCRPFLDARNGGSIIAAGDQLWAAGIYIATDDMHRLEDLETGARLNPYGPTIRLGRHVWLGRDAIVTGHVEIGEGAVVGTRSMVRNDKVPAHTAVAGTPARVVREGVTWRGEDTP